jgi:hypothetical protein
MGGQSSGDGRRPAGLLRILGCLGNFQGGSLMTFYFNMNKGYAEGSYNRESEIHIRSAALYKERHPPGWQIYLFSKTITALSRCSSCVL